MFKAAGDNSIPGEQFCFNCEEGTDKTDLSSVLPGWVFVAPQPDSSSKTDDSALIADDSSIASGLGLAQIMASLGATVTLDVEISDAVRESKLCPDTWMLGAISEDEVMCFPTWPVPFDP